MSSNSNDLVVIDVVLRVKTEEVDTPDDAEDKKETPVSTAKNEDKAINDSLLAESIPEIPGLDLKALKSYAKDTQKQEGVDAKQEALDAKLQAQKIEEVQNFLDEVDDKGLKTLASFAKDPNAFAESGLFSVLNKAGPAGLLVSTIIGLVVTSPEVFQVLVTQLAKKGLPLNQDFHRFFNKEGQLIIDRDVQYRNAVGLNVIVTSSQPKYLLTDPVFVTNNLVDLDITRYDRLTKKETQYGYIDGN